jgi:RimJ/RimL family protein N-acetyltransferase
MNLADVEADAVATTIDEEVIQAMGWSEQDVEAITTMSRDPLLMAQRGFIMVAEPGQEDQVLGVVSLTRIPGQAAEAGLGLWMAPEARGRGLGPAAIRLAAEMCWQSGVAVLTLGTTAGNVSMQRCYLAAGADLFDTCENELPDGRIVDSSWYRIHNPHA